MNALFATTLALAAAAPGGAFALDPALPHYQPRWFAAPMAPVRIVGYNDMHDLLEPIVRRFKLAHPDVAIELDLPGTRFALPALASGESELAPMGAEFTPPQLAEYRARAGGDPVAFRVAHASLDARALSGPLAIVVHRDNPLPSLSLTQVRRIFCGTVRNWGELGVGGAWARRPIVTYGLQAGTALAHEMRARALGNADFAPGLHGFVQSADVVDGVGSDPQGIGFAAAMRATAEVRVLAIASEDGAPPVAPTAHNLVAGHYPLDRYLLIYARPPISFFAREFLRLVLSREGQQAVADSPQRYLPLSAADAAAELHKLRGN